MSPKPNKSQRRAQAVAKRQEAAAAAAHQRRLRTVLWGGLAAIVVIAIVVAIVVSSGGGDAKATNFETATVKVGGTPLPQYDATVSPDPAIGKTIPTLDGKSLFDGKPVTVAPDGKPQAVIFVAHWCPHCQAEVPRLVALAKQGVFDGVEVTAVATGTNSGYPNYPPSAWLKDQQWPFPVMADSKQGTAAQAYGLSAYPYFVLVKADGTVAARASGEIAPADVKTNVEALKNGDPVPLASSSASTRAG